MLDIVLKPETLFTIGPIQVTNSLLSVFIIFTLLTTLLVRMSSKFSVSNPSKVQVLFEMVYDSLGNIFKDITKTDYKFSLLFSFVFSFFIYILFSNWFGLIPFVGPFGLRISEHTSIESPEIIETPTLINCIKARDCILTTDLKIIRGEKLAPVFRAPTSDLSLTLVLALLSVITANVLGVKSMGLGYFKKYFNFSNAIDFIVGILELISELGKIISFSFRLFGNVFAGEVLLVVISFISYGIANLPFMGLEVFLGMIQALVFFMLTTVFISLAKSQHH